MSPSNTGFMKTEQLVRVGYINSEGAAGDGMRQSLPIPHKAPNGLRVDFFFCPALARPQQPIVLYPPIFLTTLHADSGQLDMLRSVEPRNFGQAHGRDDPIGTFGMPSGMTVDEFIEKRSTLYETYDVLLPAFARGVTPGDPKLKRAAQDYTTLFELLSEPPLLPYYRAVGAEFFAWVARMRTGR